MSLRTTNLLKTLALQLPGFAAAYFLTGYFSYFYSAQYSFLVLAILFQVLCSMLAVLLLRQRFENLRLRLSSWWMSLLVLLAAAGLAVASAVISWQFPTMFNARLLFMDPARLPIFAVLIPVSAAATILLREWIGRQPQIATSVRGSTLFQFIDANLAGILLALAFLFTYLLFAQTLNFPGRRTVDQYFDTDISEWIARLTAGMQDRIPLVRAVHPAVMLILRPWVWLLSWLLHGDRLQASFLFSAIAGALCVFITWLIVKRVSNTAYALLIASLVGASASHLLLSSILETYIFSALVLLAFVLLLQSGRTSLRYTIPLGILIFGITISNLAQACILYFLRQPRLKTMTAFITSVVAITLLLNAVQVRLFPDALGLYNPANLLGERNYAQKFSEHSWRLVGRVKLIGRAILSYGVLAPKPFVLTEELGAIVPNFRTFEISGGQFHVAGYKGLASIAARLWLLFVAAAAILFFIKLFRSPKTALFPLSLLLCLVFSFFLHTSYGDDPMLYSPNWVYALVLFIASSFERWADRRWLQLVLLVFLVLMIYVNLGLIQQLMAVSLPYYGR